MDETQMMHGRDWHGDRVAGWFASEKYDGVRAYWDGLNLWTRGGCIIAAPGWFTSKLPAGVHLDGELWAGYDSLQVARVAAQNGIFTPACRFMVHDVPQMAGDWLARVRSAWQWANYVVTPAEVFPSATKAEIRAAYSKVRRRGGEGLVLRRPDCFAYLPGRSSEILKIKHDWQVF